MPRYWGFHPETIEIIAEAFSFVKSEIERYRTEKKRAVDVAHHKVIDKEIDELIERIDRIEGFLREKAVDTIYAMDAKSHEAVMDVIRSALEIYLQDTIEARARLGLVGFDKKIQEIQRTTSLEGLKESKTNLFEKYYEAPLSSPEGKRVEVFFSYSHEDRTLAGKIATLMTENGFDVFLAHEDINVSEEWREEIFKHLRSCNVLLALLTPSFEKSVWANQEAGYMRGKEGKVIPLIVGETSIKNFGFLEALQGIQMKEDTLKECVNQILSIIPG